MIRKNAGRLFGIGFWLSKIAGVIQKFRPELEVHGVVMIPVAAPDESVAMENIRNLLRNPVDVSDSGAFVGIGLITFQVIGVIDTYVKSYAIAMRALTVGSAHLAPIESA